MLKNKLFKKQKGFTLLELLIVIVIVGILAIVIIPNIISGPARARDSQRKADLKEIKVALESYFADKNYYPINLAELELGAVPFLKPVPKDPKTNENYTYITIGNPPSSYTLQTKLENRNDNDIKSGTVDIFEITSSN